MSGGNTRLTIHTRERMISSDHNRMHALDARDRAEVLRRVGDMRVDQLGGGYLEAGSYIDTIANDSAAIGAPLRADVFEGLVVLPQPGTLNLLVSPGAVGLDDPDGQAGSSDPNPPSSDDSRYKVIADPGIVVVGALTIAAGAGATRIDLIECRRQTVVLETDSRDIFDPSTGNFVPVSVTQVSTGRLLYRVTVGTPGGGIPALSQGWLPLCVASVPSSAASVDDMTFWDVRPLVADRVNAPHASRHVASFLEGRQGLYADDHTDPAKTTLSGISSSQIGMYRAGGLMPVGPGIIDVRAPGNQAAGYTPVVGKPWFLYAVFPASLPRWVKYVPFPAAPRLPNGPLGILAVSEGGPSSQFGIGDSCNPPPATGLVTPGPCALVAAGVVGSGPIERGFIAQHGLTLCNPNVGIALPAPVVAASSDTYTASANAHFPANATGVVIFASATFTGSAGATDAIHCTAYVLASDGARLAIAHDFEQTLVYGAGGVASVNFQCEVPCIPFGTLAAEPDDRLTVQIFWSSVTPRSLTSAIVRGWRL